jgi:methionine biosynthesis protein MetW
MPVTRRLPYQWYDTPNIRVGTYADFAVLARKNQLQITESFGIQDDRVVRWWPNARASTAVFRLQHR